MTTVLVVEDDDMLLSAMVSLFQRRGYDVRSAASGNQAIRILQTSEPIDVIISDYYMPDGDGRHLLDYVRTQDDSKPLFILVTGQTDMRIDNMKALGVDHFLLKPFPIRDLVALVARYAAERTSPASRASRLDP